MLMCLTCSRFRAAYEDMVCRMKKVQGLSVVEEETSYEEKLELGKNRDEEEIRLGSDVSKNEEMVEKTKRNSGEIRVRNFALTETDLGIKYRGCGLYHVSKTEITLDVTRANNNDNKKKVNEATDDDSDESQDVDTGDSEDTDDGDNATINQNRKSNNCSMESVLGRYEYEYNLNRELKNILMAR